MFSTCLKFINYLQDYNLKGVPQEVYNTILCQKAFHNFIYKKRYQVTKDIVSRYLIPYPQVIALFSFIFPEAYLHRLQMQFENANGVKKQTKRIKIY